MKTNQELRELTIEQLQSELIQLRKDQLKLRFQKASNDESIGKKLHLFSSIRRTIARVKTIIAEKGRKTS